MKLMRPRSLQARLLVMTMGLVVVIWVVAFQ